MITGLGKNRKFLYLDEFIKTEIDWEKLHADICFGLSQSKWEKKFVSSGVHKEWEKKEITPYMRNSAQNLTDYELSYYNNCTTIDEKLKYIMSLKEIPHPFWVIFIKNNIRTESTGLINKAKESDCQWTDNAKYFKSLINVINNMPFDSIGRVMIFMTEANNLTVPHYDGRYQYDRPSDDFIWFTTKPNTKKIYVMDSESLEKFYPDENKRFIWFNEMDYHGTDPVNHYSFSIRIDGVFNSEIKHKLLNI